MKIISINLGISGSTGKIIQGLHDQSVEKSDEYLMMAPQRKNDLPQKDVFYIGSNFSRRLNAYLGTITGLDGCFAWFSTMKALNYAKQFNPDVIHLHNLHNHYINLPMLFRYIKKHDVRVIWTLHDCWSFTGHCPHFAYEKCYKWQTGCRRCPRYKDYPKTIFDNSKMMWKMKKRWFTGVKHLTIVTPSQWLGELVSDSFLKNYPIRVINNGIDLEVFQYSPSDFREKYQLMDQKIILGVAFDWSNKKGLDVFVELANSLPVDCQIVLVGTDERLDQQLPDNIISIHKTGNQKELAQIYSVADVFVNPTREETFPTVNIEAIACGTPVVTFDTGGSPEIIDETCGCVVPYDDIASLKQAILRIVQTNPYPQEACVNRARSFGKEDRFDEYINMYEEE